LVIPAHFTEADNHNQVFATLYDWRHQIYFKWESHYRIQGEYCLKFYFLVWRNENTYKHLEI